MSLPPAEIGHVHERIISELTAPGGLFEITTVSAAGRQFRCFKNASETLLDLFDRAAAQFADAPLLVHPEGVMTYAALANLAAEMAGQLRSMGVVAGNRVGIAMRNRPEWFVAFVAILKAGAVPVIFNSRGAGAEMRMAVEDVPCSLIIADDDRAARLREAGVKTPMLESPGQGGAPNLSPKSVPSAPNIDDPAMILFTSGTTGRSKGVILTHRNFGNLMQNMRLLGKSRAELAAQIYGVSSEILDGEAQRLSMLLVYPMFHISGVMTFLRALDNGGQVVLMRRWDPRIALRLIHDNAVNTLSGPPLIISDLLDEPGANAQMGSIMSVGVGGQASPLNLVERVRDALPHVSQTAGWGQTETMGSLTVNGPFTFLARPESCGKPSPVVELKVIDEEGREVPAGQAGEFWARSPMVMQGYFGSAMNEEIFAPGGWFRTGDVGFVDDEGWVYLLDRKKDMVISSGENIFCAEVERALSQDVSVSEVCVFGVPDARLGEKVIAVVTLRPGMERTPAQLADALRGRIADYKIPAEIVMDFAPFPRNASGKVNKVSLRAQYLSREQPNAASQISADYEARSARRQERR